MRDRQECVFGAAGSRKASGVVPFSSSGWEGRAEVVLAGHADVEPVVLALERPLSWLRRAVEVSRRRARTAPTRPDHGGGHRGYALRTAAVRGVRGRRVRSSNCSGLDP